MRFYVLGAMVAVACLLTGLAIGRGSGPPATHLTLHEERIATTASREIGFELQTPRWMPPGWRITGSQMPLMQPIFSLAALILKGHQRRILLWEDFSNPFNLPLSRQLDPITHPVRQWHSGGRLVQESLSPGQGRTVSVIAAGSHYALSVVGPRRGVSWATLAHIAATTPLPTTGRFVMIYACHPGPHCRATQDSYLAPKSHRL